MSYIKLTSFDSWSNTMNSEGRGCPPDLLINTDHVLRVAPAARGITLGSNGLTYKPTNLIFADKTVKVAETPEHFYEAWAVGEGSVARHGGSYIEGVRTDDWGNPIEDTTAAVG